MLLLIFHIYANIMLMSTETLDQAPAPQLPYELPPEYDFMSLEAIRDCRSNQKDAQNQALGEALSSNDVLDATQEAKQSLLDSVDKDAEGYVAAHLNRDDNPELFDKLKSLVAGASYYHMDGVEWNLGEEDEQAKHSKLETSGRDQYTVALADALGIEIKDDAPADAETVQQAEANLVEARKKLAELSVLQRRRSFKNSKGGKAQKAAFDEALYEYNEAKLRVGTLQAQDWAAQGVTEDQLRGKVFHHVLSEIDSFHGEERSFIENEKGLRARLSRWMAEHHKTFMLTNGGASFGVGFGLGKVLKGTGLALASLGAAAAIPIAVAGTVAARGGKAMLQTSVGNRANLIKHQTNRAAEDRKILEGKLNGLNGDVTNMLRSAHGMLSDRLTYRTDADLRGNRRRAVGAAILGGTMGAVGYIAADVNGVKDAFGVGHHTSVGSTQPNNGSAGLPGEHSGSRIDTTGSGHTVNTDPNRPGYTDGFKQDVTIENGHGYVAELQDLANQQGIHLNGQQAYEAYQHLADKFHGNFLTNDPSYKFGSEYRISAPGMAHWNPAVLHDYHQWLIDQGIIKV